MGGTTGQLIEGGRRGLGFLDRTRVPGAAGLGGGVLPYRGGAARPRLPRGGVLAPPEGEGAGRPAQAEGEGPRVVGAVPRPRSRRPRLRSAEAGSAQRDSGPLPLRPG